MSGCKTPRCSGAGPCTTCTANYCYCKGCDGPAKHLLRQTPQAKAHREAQKLIDEKPAGEGVRRG